MERESVICEGQEVETIAIGSGAREAFCKILHSGVPVRVVDPAIELFAHHFLDSYQCHHRTEIVAPVTGFVTGFEEIAEGSITRGLKAADQGGD